jgi:transposase-like protein
MWLIAGDLVAIYLRLQNLKVILMTVKVVTMAAILNVFMKESKPMS